MTLCKEITYKDFKTIWDFVHLMKDMDLSDARYTWYNAQYFMQEPIYTIDIEWDI